MRRQVIQANASDRMQIMSDRINHVRMHLALLLHAQKYQHVADNAHTNCIVHFCAFGRKLWKHITTCKQQTVACTEQYCRVSRDMMAHWDACSKAQNFCRMCTPLRIAKQRVKDRRNKPELPNCREARDLIQHYKECISSDGSCKLCKFLICIKRLPYGPYGLSKWQRHSVLLKHSCCCRDLSCKNPMCIKMKRVLTHTNVCQTKRSDSMVCLEIVRFCLRHTISCTEKKCILSCGMTSSTKN